MEDHGEREGTEGLFVCLCSGYHPGNIGKETGEQGIQLKPSNKPEVGLPDEHGDRGWGWVLGLGGR